MLDLEYLRNYASRLEEPFRRILLEYLLEQAERDFQNRVPVRSSMEYNPPSQAEYAMQVLAEELKKLDAKNNQSSDSEVVPRTNL
jgi:hypothetical protein